jgi:hypothetical protein
MGEHRNVERQFSARRFRRRMEPRILFLRSPLLAAPPRVIRCAGQEPCVRRSPLSAAAPPRSPKRRPSQLVAAGAALVRGELREYAVSCPQLLAVLPRGASLAAGAARDSRRETAATIFARQLMAAGSRPATGAEPSYAFVHSFSFRSTDRCAPPGTEGATRAHVDTLTTLVSTSPRRSVTERAALCPRAGNDTLSPSFSPNPWLVTILSSSTSISQKPASH